MRHFIWETNTLTAVAGWAARAGSQTNPCGYSGRHYSKRQFEVADHRSLKQVIGAIAAAGYEPVFKDWDHAFIGQTTETSEV